MELTPLFAGVIIDISHEKVDKPFQYRIPDSLRNEIRVGSCVVIPFGKGNGNRTGYVIEITDISQYPIEKTKWILGLERNKVTLEGDTIALAAWIKETYGATMATALRTVLPVKKVVKPLEHKNIHRNMTTEEIHSLLGEALRKHQNAKARVLKELLEEEDIPYEWITGKLHVSAPTLRSLESSGAIRIETNIFFRNPVHIGEEQKQSFTLTKDQQYIVDEIYREYGEGIRRPYLIKGVTGSGKTFVYLSLIEKMVAMNRQCIVLIPEIALTYQTLMRFYKRFGNRVSVMNSSLSAGEKYDQFERARKGEIDVIIGPRSALFVPFPNLGMIVMDEEHEGTYRNENMPRYHAGETAEFLAKQKDAILVMGSATPSLDSFYRTQNGEYRLFSLNERLFGAQLPEVSVVDLRQELRAGNRSIFSRKLQEQIEDRLLSKEQTILFLNRRGYAGFISCRACGTVMKCPHCDVSLSQHRGRKMQCHYCGYETAEPKTCPTCGSPYILGFKAGTEQIEEQLYKRFPGIRVLRMDADTTKNKGSYEKILSSFAEGEADVLLGTQMIVKGHDFPNVTLVGVLAADLSLNDSDYRSAERTFQLLTQAVGRAGRANKKGTALIQTYRPEHYSIIDAAKQDYDGFYKEELLYRTLGDYPPTGHMMSVQISSEFEKQAEQLAQRLLREAGERIAHIGPAKASVYKVSDRYRYMIYFKSSDYSSLTEAKNRMEDYLIKAERKEEIVNFDFD